ncbi:MAG: class I SAM-dependent methyltransferase, partial [Acidimicrobiia bacterium]|nr:class I SAM-dependent methyltransferase [Acidimicrobiia bacterium]
DRWILDQRCERVSPPASEDSEVEYRRASATALPFDDHSVDYVFTDPPFGTNIFYSDMNLFQEAWMSEFTDPDEEAVIDRVDTGAARTADRYEQIMVGALRECFRVLKPGGFITLLFGNSSGKMWQLLRRSISAAGLEVVPELIVLLDKGQRSVKGLASGFENTATLDLMLTLRPAQNPPPELIEPAQEDLERYIQRQLAEDRDLSPSLLYLELLRHGFRSNWNLVRLNLRNVTEIIQSTHRTVDHRTALVSSHGAIGT